MLPEHYCNFLLNLYTEGSSNEKFERHKPFSIKRVLTIFLVTLLMLSTFLFYFTELSLILQITLGIILVISSFFSLFYLLSTLSFDLLPLMTSFLLFLVGTVQATEIFFPGNSYFIYFVSGGNCLLWLLVGFKWKIISLRISGAAGLIIIGITIFI